MILTTINEDQKSRGQNPEFLGSSFGLSSFPFDGSSAAGLAKSRFHSGQGSVLPEMMTETNSLKADAAYEESLWNLLSFTHSPQGSTPYKTALEGAAQLLGHSSSADPRQKVVLLITDGLPSDNKPSEVLAARNQLGSDTIVVILSIYSPGKNIEQQNAAAKSSLKEAWDDPAIMWGRQESGNDGFAGFDDYWAKLLGLPNEISDQQFDIDGSENLESAIKDILGQIQSCE